MIDNYGTCLHCHHIDSRANKRTNTSTNKKGDNPPASEGEKKRRCKERKYNGAKPNNTAIVLMLRHAIRRVNHISLGIPVCIRPNKRLKHKRRIIKENILSGKVKKDRKVEWLKQMNCVISSHW